MMQLRQLVRSLPVDAAPRLADPQPCLIGPGLEILAHRLLPIRAAMSTKYPPHKIHETLQNLQNLAPSKFRTPSGGTDVSVV
jgi:hypothetical protein